MTQKYLTQSHRDRRGETLTFLKNDSILTIKLCVYTPLR